MSEEHQYPDYVVENNEFQRKIAEATGEEYRPVLPPPPSPPSLPTPPRKPFPGILQSIGLTFLLLVLQLVVGIVIVFGVVIFMVITERMDTFSPESMFEIFPAWLFALMTIIVNILVLVFGLWLARRPVSETLGLRSAGGLVFIVTTPIVLGTIILLSEVDNYSRAYFPLPNFGQEEMLFLMKDLFVGLVFISFLGPLLEEFIFRGIILKGLLKRYKTSTAFIVSSLLFALVHVNPAQLIPAFAIGLILAWLYYKTQSIWPCVFAHALNNFIMVLFVHFPISYQIEGFSTLPEAGVNVFQPLWFNAMGVLLIALGMLLVKKLLPPRAAILPVVQEECSE